MVIKWLNRAIDSLQQIAEYYKQEYSENSANKIVSEIRTTVGKLKDFPELAAIEPLLKNRAKTYRSLVISKKYKAVYYIDNNTVYISQIWDCRQNPKKLKDKIRRG